MNKSDRYALRKELEGYPRHSLSSKFFELMDQIDALEQQRGRIEEENRYLRQLKQRIFDPEIMAGYQAVSRKLLLDALNLIDPAPVEHDGKTMVFKNPMAAEVLTRLSAILREMTTPEPAPTYEQALAIAAAPEPQHKHTWRKSQPDINQLAGWACECGAFVTQQMEPPEQQK